MKRISSSSKKITKFFIFYFSLKIQNITDKASPIISFPITMIDNHDWNKLKHKPKIQNNKKKKAYFE